MLILMISFPVYGETDFELEPEDEGDVYVLTAEEMQALGEYIIELENYRDRYYTLEERLEIERQAHDEAINQADKVITSLEDENQALREQLELTEKHYERSNIFRDAKIAGGGAAIAAVIIALTS